MCDVRAVDALVHECLLEHWADPAAWKTHLLAGAAKLVGLPVGLHAELADFDPGRRVRMVAPPVEHGWPSEKLRRAFFDSGRHDRNAPFGVSPVDLAFREQFGPRRAVTRVRADLVGDAEWHDHEVYFDYHRPAEMDEVAYSAVRLPGRGSTSVLAFGGRGSKPGPRERKLLALLHHAVATRIGTRLAAEADAGPHRLSRAERGVYVLLLEGLDEKAIARRLSRSRSTVNGHVAAIYAAFGVSSRAELMAYLLRRRPAPPARPPGDA